MEENKALATQTANQKLSIFADDTSFAHAQRVCLGLVKSTIVPKAYQGSEGLPNALVAFEYANRLGVSILEIMQNLDIIQGRPSFGAKYVAGRINTCGKFSELEYEVTELGIKEVEYTTIEWVNQQKKKSISKIKVNDISCVAYATNLRTGKLLKSQPITIEMAVKEGWFTKDGSKWQTMPYQMLAYRAAKFFQNMYAPELMQGIPTTEEIYDITPTQNTTFTEAAPTHNLNDKIKSQTAKVVADKPAGKKVVRKAAEPVVITTTEPSNEPSAEPNEDYL